MVGYNGFFWAQNQNLKEDYVAKLHSGINDIPTNTCMHTCIHTYIHTYSHRYYVVIIQDVAKLHSDIHTRTHIHIHTYTRKYYVVIIQYVAKLHSEKIAKLVRSWNAGMYVCIFTCTHTIMYVCMYVYVHGLS
jgi:hypothetical protein